MYIGAEITVFVEIKYGRPIGYLTTEEAAQKFNVKQGTVRQWVRRYKLPALKIGSDLWIPQDAHKPGRK